MIFTPRQKRRSQRPNHTAGPGNPGQRCRTIFNQNNLFAIRNKILLPGSQHHRLIISGKSLHHITDRINIF